MSDKRNYDILDLAKFILSIMIVCIHTQTFLSVLYPWLRLAVPLFFTISSFLLFRKINVSVSVEEEKKTVKNYCFRQMKLYLFWFIVLLPVTYYLRSSWLLPKNSANIFIYICNLIKHFLFGSTFAASWFIAASLVGTLVVYFLSKKVNDKILLCIFTILYSFLCFSSFFTKVPFFNSLLSVYETYFSSPLSSFPIALIWILIGKMFASKEINLKIKNYKSYYLSLIISLVGLFIEYKLFSNSCYICSLPVVILIFKLLLNTNIHLKNAKLLRTVSTITYPLHASIAIVVRFILKKLTSNMTLIGIVSFVITLSICYIACFIILKLENKKPFAFLKYAH